MLEGPWKPFVFLVFVAFITATRYLQREVNRPVGIAALAVAYAFMAVVFPEALYCWMEDPRGFFFVAFVAFSISPALGVRKVNLQLKEFWILPIVVLAFNVIIMVRVVDPHLGCSSYAAYGASISYICANLIPEGYVFMCAMLASAWHACLRGRLRAHAPLPQVRHADEYRHDHAAAPSICRQVSSAPQSQS